MRPGLLTLRVVAPLPVRPLHCRSRRRGAVMQAMHCFVYASQRKPDTYLWLAKRDEFACIPESLALMLGDMRFVLEVELTGQRKLPQEDAQVIMEHLATKGWHLQLPPSETLAAANHPAYKSAPTDRGHDD